jgi:two-component system, NtrC family, sensor kinase
MVRVVIERLGTLPDIPRPESDVLVALNRSATAARLLSGVIHEVNNALQVISGTVELMQTRPDVPPAMAPGLERLNKQTARAAAVLSDVLVFTRGSVRESGYINVREIAEHSLTLRAFSIKRANLTSRLMAPADLRFVSVGNRSKIQQALLNLIVNAEQALAGTAGEIVVELGVDGESVLIRVMDQGHGIDAHTRQRIFGAFISTRDPWEGAGLGLWAARVIAEEHGGTLTCEDRPIGAAVTLRLPRAPV